MRLKSIAGIIPITSDDYFFANIMLDDVFTRGLYAETSIRLAMVMPITLFSIAVITVVHPIGFFGCMTIPYFIFVR
jgi:hypothetical protein